MGEIERVNAMVLAEELNKAEPFGVMFGYNARGQVTLSYSQAQALLGWINRQFPKPDALSVARECVESTKSQNYNKIAAIKEYRIRTGAGLRQALDMINQVWVEVADA